MTVVGKKQVGLEAGGKFPIVLLSALIVLGIALSGCDDGGSGPDADTEEEGEGDIDGIGDPDVDAVDVESEDDQDLDAEAQDDGGDIGPLTVTVTGIRHWPDFSPHPIEGAIVALDPRGGERMEATTDAEGRATFDGSDLSAGIESVTAWAEGYGLMSRFRPDRSSNEVTLHLPLLGGVPGAWWDTTGWIEVSGTALNMTNESHLFGVSCYETGAWFQNPGPDWMLRVPPGMELTLIAMEWTATAFPDGSYDQPFYGWIVQTVGPLSAPATVDLDFASAITPTSVHGSFLLPARVESPLRRGRPYAYVQSRMTPEITETVAGALGFPSHAAFSADGDSVEYDIEYVTPPGAADVETEYFVNGPSRERSAAFVAGYPTDGAQDFALLDTPQMVDPPNPTELHGLHDPIVWRLFDEGVEPVLDIRRDGTSVWRVAAPVDGTILTVPQPPSTVDIDALLGFGPLEAVMEILSETPEEPCYHRMAMSGKFLLEGEAPPPCAVDLTEWFYTTESCWMCTAENCCEDAEALEADPDGYDAYLALVLCSSAHCEDDCPPVSFCALYGSGGLIGACSLCVDGNCCAEVIACFDEETCSACNMGSYDPVTCCASEAFGDLVACVDRSCADECQACVDCHCGT